MAGPSCIRAGPRPLAHGPGPLAPDPGHLRRAPARLRRTPAHLRRTVAHLRTGVAHLYRGSGLHAEPARSGTPGRFEDDQLNVQRRAVLISSRNLEWTNKRRPTQPE